MSAIALKSDSSLLPYFKFPFVLPVAGGSGPNGLAGIVFYILKKMGFHLYKIVVHLNFSVKLQNTGLESGQ